MRYVFRMRYGFFVRICYVNGGFIIFDTFRKFRQFYSDPVMFIIAHILFMVDEN